MNVWDSFCIGIKIMTSFVLYLPIPSSLCIQSFPLWRANSQSCGSPDTCGRKAIAQRKRCGFKYSRICVEGALVYSC